MTVLTVLVFGPESVSYERSCCETAAKFDHFSTRIFFEIISKSKPSMIYCILVFFRIHIPNMDSFANVSVTRPGRPAARPPVMDHRLSNWFVFQYSQVHRLSNWLVFQYFPGSQVINMDRFISRFTGCQNGSFSNTFRILSHPD